ncbi:thiol peroxidase, atypical 2-Cys peroxiredoxin [Bifidobacterium bohemicum]|uniref:Thiol peroxidase n=1 Tax=Bifidobacterium bohemicum DSM 22767 TaxID=1437606 RepID=A0A086ZEG2_9BIFI|nr:thiol peroxidase [Bifidobacterium bohemicum]KFI44912.1 thiol peroxidase [Bifidobacterium bohemicum DSM 22767]SCB97182.1 thiol peroxidase, atypical 2-Cys peroxiredoxin [Bifidobacterium bohemicum]
MAQITLNGNPTHTVGNLPEVGSVAPSFSLSDADLNDFDSTRFKGRRLVLNIFPSVDTDVCSMSVRRFNQMADELEGVTVVCVSRDLPFALGRFCGANGIENVVVGSAFRSSFGEDYGVTITDGGMKGLLSRAVVIIGSDGRVAYVQQVPEIGTEPDYDAARKAIESLK